MKHAKFMTKFLFLVFLILVVLIVSCKPGVSNLQEINSFEDCKNAGYQIKESYPAQCSTPDGRTFTEELVQKDKEKTSPPTRSPCENRCGDGICQEIVCLATGCPCAETPESCPSDCSGGVSGEGIAEPEDPEKSGLYDYPDYQLDSIPPTPISVKYLVEHRSALNEKVVTVNGIVVANWLKMKCPENAGLLCPQPRIFLADSMKEDRDLYYDLDITVSEEEKSYEVGETVEVKITVYGDKIHVYAEKIY